MLGKGHLATSFVLVVLASPAGCEDKKSGGETPAAAAAAPSASASAAAAAASASAAAAAASASGGAPAAPAARNFRAGPAATAIDSALALDLDEGARATVENLADKLDADEDDSPRADLKSLHDDIVAAVRAGDVDAAKLGPRVAALEKTMQARLDKEAVALNALWGALDAEKRKALAAALRTKARERDEDAARAAGDGGATRPMTVPARSAQLTKELDLDAAQKAKLDGVLAKLGPESDWRAEASKRFDAFVLAIEGATFDAKKLDAFSPAAAKARVPMGREVQLLSLLVPILKPEQKNALAGRLEGEPMRAGTGIRDRPLRDWPFPFEVEVGDVITGPAPTKPRPPKGAKKPAPGATASATAPPGSSR